MRKFVLGIAVIVILIGGAFGADRLLSRPASIPTTTARRGELLISLRVNGTLDAKRAHTIVAPRIRNIQITWLAPEGQMVQAGDSVVRFDATQQQADLADNESGLRIAETSLERARQELTIQEKQLQLALRQAQRNYDEMRHEAPKVAEEARLELEVAELNARARLDQIRSDVQKAELEVQRARDKVAAARRELEQMTLTAPIPGMVVYLEIWKGNAEGKVQAGDSPWPGQGIINLPDLSDMIVRATVSEVDASRVRPDQEAIVVLDALPEERFAGKVTSKGTLARRKEMNSKINVFDVEIALETHDERLKPGMSAASDIVIERLEDRVAVPLEAVFEVEGKPVVYLGNRKRRDVEVGRRSDFEMEIASGLEGGETICLIDPAIAGKERTGEQATEPEINRGRIDLGAPASPAKSGS